MKNKPIHKKTITELAKDCDKEGKWISLNILKLFAKEYVKEIDRKRPYVYPDAHFVEARRKFIIDFFELTEENLSEYICKHCGGKIIRTHQEKIQEYDWACSKCNKSATEEDLK